MDCIWENFTNVGPPFSTFSNLYQFTLKMSFTQLENHSSSVVTDVAVILQMKDSCSANLTFRAHN